MRCDYAEAIKNYDNAITANPLYADAYANRGMSKKNAGDYTGAIADLDQSLLLKPDYSFQDIPTSFVTHSVLNIKDKDTIERLQKVAGLIIQYPRLRGFLIFAAKHIKSDLLHFALYLMSQILRMRVERKLTFYQAVSYLWTYRKGI